MDRRPTDRTDDTRRLAADAAEFDRIVEPEGYIVAADDGTRLHFLDWGAPGARRGADDADDSDDAGIGASMGRAANGGHIADGTADAGDTGPQHALPGVLLLHGLARTSWSWAPVARRLANTLHVVAPDTRGHGLSDAPTVGYDAETLALDALAVAEASELLPGPVILAGHGSGGIAGIEVAARLGAACGGLVLVDGGWDAVDLVERPTVEEWLRSIEEPPEVLASMAAFLADRADFDPATWDADQERAARSSVVELPAGRVVLVTRRHVLAAMGVMLLADDPLDALPRVTAPIVALAARDDPDGARTDALDRARAAVRAAGRPAMTVVSFPADGHDLVRYRPRAVAGAILDLAHDAVAHDAAAHDARPDPGVPSPG